MRASLQFLLASLLAAGLCGCASSSKDTASTDSDKRYVITYYDRNNDGKVDFELHRLPGVADADWALCDTQFRGRYDLRISWGHVLEKKPVDIPVATKVPITPGQPPISEIK